MPVVYARPNTDRLHCWHLYRVQAPIQQLRPGSGCQDIFLFLPVKLVQTTLKQCFFLFGVHPLKLFIDFYHHLTDHPCHHFAEHHIPGVPVYDMGTFLRSLWPGIAAANRYVFARYVSRKKIYFKNLLTHLTNRILEKMNTLYAVLWVKS